MCLVQHFSSWLLVSALTLIFSVNYKRAKYATPEYDCRRPEYPTPKYASSAQRYFELIILRNSRHRGGSETEENLPLCEGSLLEHRKSLVVRVSLWITRDSPHGIDFTSRWQTFSLCATLPGHLVLLLCAGLKRCGLVLRVLVFTSQGTGSWGSWMMTKAGIWSGIY
jgi:hypothetical protein